MIILGHKIIPSEHLVEIKSLGAIDSTPSQSVVIFDYDIDMMHYCFTNQIPYGVKVSGVAEAIFGNSLGAKYLFIRPDDGEKIQKIAENYMFDSKIICEITDDEEIEVYAHLGIDGVIYRDFLKGERKYERGA